jgi:uncharacterized protein
MGVVTRVEIPAADLDRAVEFYSAVLAARIEKGGTIDQSCAILPGGGMIVQGKKRAPSGGVALYLDIGDDLDAALDRIEPAGGLVLSPPEFAPDGDGLCVVFIDTEGNCVGLQTRHGER